MNPTQPIVVTQSDIQTAIRTLDLSGQAVCIHSSLRSFGRVSGGAQTVAQTLDYHCGRPTCERCRDALLDGPILPS